MARKERNGRKEREERTGARKHARVDWWREGERVRRSKGSERDWGKGEMGSEREVMGE